MKYCTAWTGFAQLRPITLLSSKFVSARNPGVSATKKLPSALAGNMPLQPEVTYASGNATRHLPGLLLVGDSEINPRRTSAKVIRIEKHTINTSEHRPTTTQAQQVLAIANNAASFGAPVTTGSGASILSNVAKHIFDAAIET